MHNTLLNIITPFKSTSLIGLKKSVNNLTTQKFISIKHIVVCDQSAYKLTRKYFESEIICTKNYKYRLLISYKKGIYTSINQGLDCLKDSQPYLVLGEGDILNIYSCINLDREFNIFHIPYSLSSKRKTLINEFRFLYMGMPYCHNALIFRKNHIKYDQQYYLSADYDYYLKFLSTLSKSKILLNQKKNIAKVNGCNVIFDDQNGLSSKKKNVVHFQNLLIISRKYLILGSFLYVFSNLLKFFLKPKS